MSKPQLASEPSMEEILSSIRKMISDDRPGPSPMPDQLSRMHFGEQARASPRAGEPHRSTGGARARTSIASPMPSRWRPRFPISAAPCSMRSPASSTRVRAVTDPLSEGPAPVAKRHPSRPPPAQCSASALDGARAAAGQPDGKRELLSFDFGTVVPQREDQSAKAGADAKPAVVDETPRAEAEKAENKVEQSARSRACCPCAPLPG